MVLCSLVINIMPKNFFDRSPFRFLPTRIFRTISGGGPLISVGIFTVPFLTNRFFALIREFGKGIKNGKSHCYWVFLLISDRSVWHNGKHSCPSNEESRETFEALN